MPQGMSGYPSSNGGASAKVRISWLLHTVLSSTHIRIFIDDSMRHEDGNNATLHTKLALRPSSYMQRI